MRLPYPRPVVKGRGVPDIDYAVELPAAATTPAVVRSRLTSMLVGWPADTVERTRAVASEVVTNAIVHAGLHPQRDTLIVSIMIRGETLRVSVQQPTGVPPLADRPRGEGHHGIGLTIVSAFADDWGFFSAPPGRVWFEVSRSRESEPAV
jgi:anti-sigma regulatory factor (Ser/Thr protein kinase)